MDYRIVYIPTSAHPDAPNAWTVVAIDPYGERFDLNARGEPAKEVYQARDLVCALTAQGAFDESVRDKLLRDLDAAIATTTKPKKRATFRILHFPKVDRYLGIAWNYDEAVLISTRDFESYSQARKELAVMCDVAHVELKWFDGEYTVVNDQLVPKDQ